MSNDRIARLVVAAVSCVVAFVCIAVSNTGDPCGTSSKTGLFVFGAPVLFGLAAFLLADAARKQPPVAVGWGVGVLFATLPLAYLYGFAQWVGQCTN